VVMISLLFNIVRKSVRFVKLPSHAPDQKKMPRTEQGII